jgi:hypothetical protein
MPTIFAASESKVLVNGNVVEGVQSLQYNRQQARQSLYAVGSSERIGVVSGASLVQGQLRVLSTSAALDGLDPAATFQLSAQLAHGAAKLSVSFEECYLENKSVELNVSGSAEALYTFTATRVKEEAG